MEELLLEILTKEGSTPKGEGWFVTSVRRVDFAYEVLAQNDCGYVDEFTVSIDAVFVFLYSNAGVSIPGDEPRHAPRTCSATSGKGWSGGHNCKLTEGHDGPHVCGYEQCDFQWPNASVSIPGGEPGYAPRDCSATQKQETTCK